jgi:hypothetical protein
MIDITIGGRRFWAIVSEVRNGFSPGLRRNGVE